MSEQQIKEVEVFGHSKILLARKKDELEQQGYMVIESRTTASGYVLTAKKNSPPQRPGVQFVD